MLCGATVESVEVAEGAEPADCAEANAGIEAKIKRANHFFIAIVLTIEFPCKDRIHAREKLSRELCVELLKIWTCKSPKKIKTRPESAAEFHGFEPVNSVALIGDDMRLPNEAERHQAHKKDTDSQRQVGVGLLRRKAKSANEPGHS